MGAIANKVNNNLDKKQPQTIQDFVKLYSGAISKALPRVMTAERFSRMVLTAITNNPKLSQCSPESFVGSMLQAAQLGLEPNTPLGQAYLIPYGRQCQFQIGYKGLIDLAHRSGEFCCIDAHIVYSNDVFEFQYGLNADLKHIPAKTNRGEPEWVYAVYKLKSGGYAFEVMSYEECLKHGQRYSKTYNNGPWQTNPEEMAKKTLVKKVLKYAPLKSDFITSDEKDYQFNTNDSTFTPIIETEQPIDAIVVNPETGEVIEDDK